MSFQTWSARVWQQVRGVNPFGGNCLPTRVSLFGFGRPTLPFPNGPIWRRQKRMSAEPFSRSNLFRPEKFHGFEQTFRKTVAERLEKLRSHQQASGEKVSRIQLEPEIKVLMLEMLVNNFFGGNVSEKELRNRFVPAIEILIDHMISDTVAPITLALQRMFTGRNAILRQKAADFEALT